MRTPFLLLLLPLPLLHSLPTMIRLGYQNCASCHISPQGAGLLNSYGRAIDLAQSLKGGEPKDKTNSIMKVMSMGGRLTQDVRYTGQDTLTTVGSGPNLGVLRDRFFYRNAFEIGRGFRFSSTTTVEDNAAPRPVLKYDKDLIGSDAYLSSALVSWRPRDGVEFAIGRDALPTALNLPNLALFIRSRNRAGYYDFPTQAKVFIWRERWAATGYVFGPSGTEKTGEHETGEGAMAEIDVLGQKKTVVGVNALRAASTLVDRSMVGPYARLGFGQWGILLEQDFSHRTVNLTRTAFWQQTTYGQLFWAYREWLVPSLIAERLSVQAPYRESLYSGAVEVAARLSGNFTITVNARLQRNPLTGVYTKSGYLSLAIKTAP
jgi:hypothetical protein